MLSVPFTAQYTHKNPTKFQVNLFGPYSGLVRKIFSKSVDQKKKQTNFENFFFAVFIRIVRDLLLENSFGLEILKLDTSSFRFFFYDPDTTIFNKDTVI